MDMGSSHRNTADTNIHFIHMHVPLTAVEFTTVK